MECVAANYKRNEYYSTPVIPLKILFEKENGAKRS